MTLNVMVLENEPNAAAAAAQELRAECVDGTNESSIEGARRASQAPANLGIELGRAALFQFVAHA